jgi:hypothetical protein
MSIDPFASAEDYESVIQVKLEDIIANTPAHRVGLVIRKVLENLVLAERMALENGLDISDRDRQRLMRRDYPEIQAEVDRAIGVFIGSIVSAEGG